MTLAGSLGRAPESPETGAHRALLEEALSIYRMDPGLALHRAAEAMLMSRLALSGPILDLGCHDGGFGWLALRPASKLTDIFGSDRNLTGLAQCRARGVHRSVLGLDATRLPFRDRAFGGVLCNSVLTHVDELSDALSEIARVLAIGGLLAATVPTPAFHELFAPVRVLRALGLRGVAQRMAASYDQAWHQRHFLGKADWRKLLEDAGMNLESWDEYLDAQGSMQWSSLFVLTRIGAGRVTLGALLRRMFPAGTARTSWLERSFARWLAPALRAGGPGGSALLVARRNGPSGNRAEPVSCGTR